MKGVGDAHRDAYYVCKLHGSCSRKLEDIQKIILLCKKEIKK